MRIYTGGCGERQWLPDGRLSAAFTVGRLRAGHKGHYFDADAMRFFGTEHFAMPASGVSIEEQTEAPDDCPRWKATAWFDRDEDGVQPWTLCRHESKEDAIVCAVAASEELSGEGTSE
jgi:hypothetical protein